MYYTLQDKDDNFSIGVLDITINKESIHKVEYQALIDLRTIKEWFLMNYDKIDNYLYLRRNDKTHKYHKRTIKNYIL